MTLRHRTARARARGLLVTLPMLALLAVAMGSPSAAYAATQPRLGTLTSFAVVAGSAITNTGPSVVTGDLGLYPGTSATGFGGAPNGTLVGASHIAPDAAAQAAQNDLVIAYNDAANAPSTSSLSGDLGGKNLTPGVYTYGSSAQLTGPVTLNGDGVYIFQVGSSLTTASDASVVLTGGAQACAVFWQVTSSATLGTRTRFQGNLMALTSITMTTGASLTGRALARNGALTLDTNTVTVPTGPCTVPAASGSPSPNGSASPSPLASASPSAAASASPSPIANANISPTAPPEAESSPSPTPVVRLPSAGRPGGRSGSPPWVLLVACAVGVLGAGLTSRFKSR